MKFGDLIPIFLQLATMDLHLIGTLLLVVFVILSGGAALWQARTARDDAAHAQKHRKTLERFGAADAASAFAVAVCVIAMTLDRLRR